MNEKQSSRLIAGKIRSLTTSHANMRDVAKQTAHLIVRHAMVHGDISAAGRLIDAVPVKAWQQSLVKFFRASGAAISIAGGKHAASKRSGYQCLEGADPLAFQAPGEEEARKKRADKAAARKAEKALQASKDADELQSLRDDSRKAKELREKLSTLKAENSALKNEVARLRAALAEEAKAA